MNRRDFITSSCAACVSMAAIPTILGSCSALINTTGKLVKDGLTLIPEDFIIRDKGSIAYRSFLIVRNDALKYPVYVYRINEKEYAALWMKCSHQGAELQASGDYLQCPAHGSEFSNKGVATSGPASADLRTFPVSVSDKEIFIDLRKQS